MNREMTLNEALAVLCGVHLRAFEFDDWHIEMGALPSTPWDAESYAPAWAIVRQHVRDARDAAQMAATRESSTPRS